MGGDGRVWGDDALGPSSSLTPKQIDKTAESRADTRDAEMAFPTPLFCATGAKHAALSTCAGALPPLPVYPADMRRTKNRAVLTSPHRLLFLRHTRRTLRFIIPLACSML